jgi:hypothetical protein
MGAWTSHETVGPTPIPIMPVIPIRRVGDMSERRQLERIETHRGIPEEPAQQSFES